MLDFCFHLDVKGGVKHLSFDLGVGQVARVVTIHSDGVRSLRKKKNY